MDKPSQTGNRRLVTRNFLGGNCMGDDDGDRKEECPDVEACETLSRSLTEVQRYLDRNRMLIEQVNNNQKSMIPSNLARNVALIREINDNIARVRALYSTMSSDFTGKVKRRRGESSSRD